MPVPDIFDALKPFQNGGDGALDGGGIVAVPAVQKAAADQPVHIGWAIFDNQATETPTPAIEKPSHPDGARLVAAPPWLWRRRHIVLFLSRHSGLTSIDGQFM